MMKRLANIFCVALIVLMTMTSAAVFAETETGTGDGTGGGSDVAFALVQTTPANGATGVDVNASIWLLFNKNVVNMAVRDNNMASIVLRDSNGDKVSAKVTTKDDQIQPEYRREIVVVPSDPLEPGAAYKLTIGSEMQAKNGQTLGKTYVVTFTTAEKKTTGQQSDTVDHSQNQDVDTPKGDTSSDEDKSAGSPTASGEVSTESANHGGDAIWIAMLLLGIVLLLGSTAALVIMKNRSKKVER